MKYLKMLGLAAFAAMAFTAFVGAGTASATTLEVGGVPQSGPVKITASLKAGTSALLRDTFGFSANTCKESHVAGETETNFHTKPTGNITELTFDGCTHPVTVLNKGQLYVEHDPNTTTHGLVYSENAEVTVWSEIHDTYINCKTGAGTLLGTLTGVSSGHAELHIHAGLKCEPHLSSATWKGTYIVTTPTGLGVTT